MKIDVKYSIVIPSYNEEKSLLILLEKIKSIFLEKVKLSDFEIVFIDDGSTDDSYRLVENWMNNTKVQISYYQLDFTTPGSSPL